MRISLAFFKDDYVLFPCLILFLGNGIVVILNEIKFGHNVS